MDIHNRLGRIIEGATTPAGALSGAAAAIAEDQGSDACGIFLRDPKNRLTLWAHQGEGLDERARAVAETVAGKAVTSVLAPSSEGPERTVLAAPLMAHARQLGVLVVERRGDAPYSAEQASRLSAVAAEIIGVVEGARVIEEIGRAPGADEPELGAEDTGEEVVLTGTAASPGIAIGAAVFRQAFPHDIVRRAAAAGGADAERARLRDALQKTRNDLARLEAATAAEIGEEHALVFGAHLLLLSDPMIEERIERSIAAGRSAASAVDEAFEEMARRLRLVGDPSLQERVEDVEDLRSRILDHVLGAEQPGPVRAQIVVSPRMTPSLVVELKARGALGIVTEVGGTTSHGVLLARALGVPAVTGLSGVLQRVLAGELIAVDGGEGRVTLRPTMETLSAHRARSEAAERHRTEFLTYRDRAPETADGVRFGLLANIALGVDLEAALENGAEGIGLYRTEFPFIVREAIPTLEEQVRIYAKAYRMFPAHPITFRILDVAGDKFVPGSGLGVARDAFHGYRSLRVLFDYPHVLRDQVQAFALAAGQNPLSILVPMVTSVEEIRRVKEIVASALAEHPETASLPRPRLGAMIEVPGAVEIASDLAKEVEFFSIGTNDLVQYALVIDREDSRLSTPHDAFHPAILRMVRRVVRAAREAGKPVSVCGEMAARPEIAIALLALGVDTLSVTPQFIPELKQRLASVPLGPLQRSIDGILALPTAAELEGALRAYALGPQARG